MLRSRKLLIVTPVLTALAVSVGPAAAVPGPAAVVDAGSHDPHHVHADGHVHDGHGGAALRVEATAPSREALRQGPGQRFEQLTPGLELLAHVPFDQGTDMQFQRREGRHLRAGTVVDGPRDYAFLGSDASSFRSAGGRPPADGVGFRVVDVTDPRAPEVLMEVACSGFKSDIALYENLLVQGIERDGPFHGTEGAPSNRGCARVHDPDGLDMPGSAGARIFDISDPARPRLVRFVAAGEFGGGGVHNVTVVPWAGLAYLSTFTLFGPEPRFVYLDLRDEHFSPTVIPMRAITPSALNECHEVGVDPARQFAFCGAFEQGHIWDISDPRRPKGLATMTNDGIFHYHGMRLAPDGRTLVIGAEQTGPDELALSKEVGIGGNACVGAARSGALWFYDIEDPRSPDLLGTFAPSTPMPTKGFCTSHFYNFIPDTDTLITSWMEGGAFLVDYGDLPGLRGTGRPEPLTAEPEETAWFLPAGASFWSAYYWRGHLYGLGYGGEPGGGLWIMGLDGLEDHPPAPQDEGTSWGRWTAAAIGGASSRCAPPGRPGSGQSGPAQRCRVG